MDRQAIVERLHALATDDKKRSKTARLRDLFNDVEAALAAGVSRASVVETLSTHGLDMSLATFDTSLRRIRQKRSATAGIRTPISPTLSTTHKIGTQRHRLGRIKNEEEHPKNTSHNPADIDKIIGDKPDLTALAKLAKRTKK